MMSLTQQVVVGVSIAVFAVLYMGELSTSLEDESVELGSTEVMLVANCPHVFNYMSDLSNYPQWFPGISNMTELQPGPMQNGKKFEEITVYPIIGEIARKIFVSSFTPTKQIQFTYMGWNKLTISITAIAKEENRCLIQYKAATKNTSYLYHLFVGVPQRIVYSLRGRHAMFAIRSMFNNAGYKKPRRSNDDTIYM